MKKNVTPITPRCGYVKNSIRPVMRMVLVYASNAGQPIVNLF